MYRVMYLPMSYEHLSDGCKIMDPYGNIYTYDPDAEFQPPNTRPAKLFIVKMEYNIPMAVGTPSLEALKWLQPGMELKEVDCELWTYDIVNKKYIGKTSALNSMSAVEVIRVKCSTCQQMH